MISDGDHGLLQKPACDKWRGWLCAFHARPESDEFVIEPREVKRVKPSRFAAATALRHRLSCLRFFEFAGFGGGAI